MKNLPFFLFLPFLFFSCGQVSINTEAQHKLRHKDRRIRTDAGFFYNNLGSTDDTVHQALRTLDANAGTGHGNGANCAAGEIALGVDANGAVESCYEPAEADITDLSHSTECSTASCDLDVATTINTAAISTGSHTSDTNANTICAGTNVYLDGEGNCDTIAAGSLITKYIVLFDKNTNHALSFGAYDWKAEIPIGQDITGLDITDFFCQVTGNVGTTGTLDIRIRRCPAVATGRICLPGTGDFDITSTVLTVDSNEDDSGTAAASYVIGATADTVTQGEMYALFVDSIHSTIGQGLICELEFQ